MAACRKLIVQIYHMLTRREYHYFRDEKNHMKKMMQYNHLLSKHGIKTQEVA